LQGKWAGARRAAAFLSAFCNWIGSFKIDTDGKWQPSEFSLKFQVKSSEVTVGKLICGQKSVPVYNLLEHFLSQFEM
jgi:hypothetical protein